MPHGNMLQVSVLFADLRDCIFETIWKPFSVRLKFFPTLLELRFVFIVLIDVSYLNQLAELVNRPMTASCHQ